MGFPDKVNETVGKAAEPSKDLAGKAGIERQMEANNATAADEAAS